MFMLCKNLLVVGNLLFLIILSYNHCVYGVISLQCFDAPVGVAPTRTVGTLASIIFPCSIKIQKTGGGETQPERSTTLC